MLGKASPRTAEPRRGRVRTGRMTALWPAAPLALTACAAGSPEALRPHLSMGLPLGATVG